MSVSSPRYLNWFEPPAPFLPLELPSFVEFDEAKDVKVPDNEALYNAANPLHKNGILSLLNFTEQTIVIDSEYAFKIEPVLNGSKAAYKINIINLLVNESISSNKITCLAESTSPHMLLIAKRVGRFVVYATFESRRIFIINLTSTLKFEDCRKINKKTSHSFIRFDGENIIFKSKLNKYTLRSLYFGGGGYGFNTSFFWKTYPFKLLDNEPFNAFVHFARERKGVEWENHNPKEVQKREKEVLSTPLKATAKPFTPMSLSKMATVKTIDSKK